ncbi:MAG: hypothetical protein HDT05_05405 [Bacteroidales bacterium]|nr:hypothetical protein [Bacteroidales bacterium]
MKKQINLRGTLHVTDWLSDITYAPEEENELVQVLFKNTRSAFFRNPDRLPLKKGDWVAVEASPGHDIGKVMLTGPLVRLQMKKAGQTKDSEIKRIFRKASEADIEKFKEAREREHTTMIRSRQIAADLGLNMKIGDVEYQGDGAKAIFYYIADERVDFRKLIRILADTFKIRIEMKQIGARQEAGRIGGIGPCGRPLCCSSWMSKFVSVGTGAARIQDLSMNPQKLAGQCGKLKCCLNFETDAYAEAAKEFPPKDAVLITQDQEYYQFKTDILARTITYSTDKHAAVNLVTISTDRAKEIIAINRRGEKPEQLEAEKVVAAPRQEYVELVGQDSLTRFDKKGKKKKKGKGGDLKKDTDSEKAGTSKKTPETKKGQESGRKSDSKRENPLKKENVSKNRVDNSRPNDTDRQQPKARRDDKSRKEQNHRKEGNENQDKRARDQQSHSGKDQREGKKPRRNRPNSKNPKGNNNGNGDASANNAPADTSAPVKKQYGNPDASK